MRLGKLRHRVTFQEYTAGRDSLGGETPVWTDVHQVWASIEPLSGREYFAAQQVQAEATARITLRYLEGIKPIHRIVFGSRTFEILSLANPEERKEKLILLCKEVLKDG